MPEVTPLSLSSSWVLYRLAIPADGTAWLIAPYRKLTQLATELRHSKTLRTLLVDEKIRLGLRRTDRPPAGLERKKSYGATEVGTKAEVDYSSDRIRHRAVPVDTDQLPSINRRTDREQNVKEFWATQTPQCHHIVEFNNLRTLGRSRKIGTTEMDYEHLPAVLLAAEFHQRYYSALLRPAQWWSPSDLAAGIAGLYDSVYLRSDLFVPLAKVSRAILSAGKIA